MEGGGSEAGRADGRDRGASQRELHVLTQCVLHAFVCKMALWLQGSPKWPQDVVHIGPEALRWPKVDPNKPQDGPKEAPRRRLHAL